LALAGADVLDAGGEIRGRQPGNKTMIKASKVKTARQGAGRFQKQIFMVVCLIEQWASVRQIVGAVKWTFARAGRFRI